MDKLTEVAYERKWKFFEVRGGKAFEALATPALEFYEHTLDLRRGAEYLFTHLNSSVRRALRKAERSRLSVQITRTREAMLEFYRLHTRTRRRHGLPPQPFSFFLNIHDEIIKPSLGPRLILRVNFADRPSLRPGGEKWDGTEAVPPMCSKRKSGTGSWFRF